MVVGYFKNKFKSDQVTVRNKMQELEQAIPLS
jgi:hypothetical protein